MFQKKVEEQLLKLFEASEIFRLYSSLNANKKDVIVLNQQGDPYYFLVKSQIVKQIAFQLLISPFNVLKNLRRQGVKVQIQYEAYRFSNKSLGFTSKKSEIKKVWFQAEIQSFITMENTLLAKIYRQLRIPRKCPIAFWNSAQTTIVLQSNGWLEKNLKNKLQSYGFVTRWDESKLLAEHPYLNKESNIEPWLLINLLNIRKIQTEQFKPLSFQFIDNPPKANFLMKQQENDPQTIKFEEQSQIGQKDSGSQGEVQEIWDKDSNSSIKGYHNWLKNKIRIQLSEMKIELMMIEVQHPLWFFGAVNSLIEIINQRSKSRQNIQIPQQPSQGKRKSTKVIDLEKKPRQPNKISNQALEAMFRVFK